MTRDKRPLYAIAAAILVVGLVALGVPIGTIIFLAILAGCPLMMFFMMRGMHGEDMHGGHDQTDQSVDDDRDPLRKRDHRHPYGHGRA
ncbi:DUF2933 domain-containing protein [Streptomyces sp. NPDC001435]|uniref:DUF2933 domain-containing protein n=1 Tax=unclassified Streptomyces TaxID=2593676 RepID=UPI0036B36D42